MGGPRYLKGTESHINYNILCYLFNHVLYNFAVGKSITLVNNFLETWKEGSRNLLKCHGWKETVSVLLQHVRYTRYGAVHYCQSKYSEMYKTISVALHCLDEPPSVSSQVWDKENGVYVHYLLGNKGAHITMGNIKPKNETDNESKSLRENGNLPEKKIKEYLP